MQKVLVVIITADQVKPQCWQSILDQDYPNFDCLVHIRKPKINSVDDDSSAEHKYLVKKYVNCTDNREVARKIALASDAERFLFVDSDVVLPKNAISELMKQPFDVQGGWYNVAHENRYTCG